jgi:hypothetical protein
VGLGARTRADRIEVAWPAGATDSIADVDADQLVVIREGSGMIRHERFAGTALNVCKR